MKFSEARQGRVFVIRLEDGEIIHETIERFAGEQGIKAAALILLGGAEAGSRLVVGPQDGRVRPVIPMVHELTNVNEIVGTGTLFPDEGGNPILHLHAACGRENSAVTGCIRSGVKVWQIVEVVLFELIETSATRKLEPDLGFKLLTP